MNDADARLIEYLAQEPKAKDFAAYLEQNPEALKKTPGLRTFVEAYRFYQEASETDPVTELQNKRGFDKQLGIILSYKRRQRDNYPLSLIIYDVDDFKAINDSHGYKAGDKVLRAVAEVLSMAYRRRYEPVARYYGDEFTIGQYEPDDVAREVAATVAKAVQEHSINSINTGLSFGVCQWCMGQTHAEDMTIEQLFDSATKELHRMKELKKVGR